MLEFRAAGHSKSRWETTSPSRFDDFSATKVRPAVCLTNAIGEHSHVVVAFIASRISAGPLSTDIILQSEHPDFGLTGLRVPSMIQLHRLMTVNTGLIKRELGELSPGLEAAVAGRLRKLFDL